MTGQFYLDIILSMSETESKSYKKCVNCGKYCPEVVMINGAYCSEDCADQYGCCKSCGRYYSLDTEFTQGFCSRACHNTYTNTEEEVKE